ncbi:hypothetical protein F2P81_011923 [Scophthalmus maximus]|uniref:Reverse transcriptase domain-containing protein n=1 Tax=Scophthalmus maximus TaxID=52904 RepID=A0A6A4T031_SCOMX|nr:hypothetical protein F2P81_011923 [Scophthalmus maximus]
MAEDVTQKLLRDIADCECFSLQLDKSTDYSPLIQRVKPSVTTIKVWPAGTDSLLQDKFHHTDWSMFASQATCGSHTDIDTYTSSVLDYINTTVGSVTTWKQITTYPNQKPWMNKEVRLLLKARNIAFRSGDALAYSISRANLRRGIIKAKHCYKLKVEEHFSNSDPRRMWQGIQAISDYKPSNSTPITTDVSFLNELNHFYARFDRDNRETQTTTRPPSDDQPLSLTSSDVHAALSQINVRKAAGPDGTPGRVLRGCAEQLTGVFTDIFNLSLAQAAVPACFKATSIVPVPKHSSPTGLNDYRPVALTPIIMKCFERLVLAHLKNCLPPTLDSYQFAYRSNRSTEDAVSTVLHSVLTHLDNNNTYARMLFVDFSSAFNTVIPSKLNTKLGDLGFNNPLRHWLMDFLTNRPQYVKSGHTCSTTITLNTGVPQGCVLSPFLYSLFTHDCRPVHGSNTIIKFADDTPVIGLISNNDETAYREEVQHLAAWCADNNLLLNTSKTKELIVDFRRKRGSTHNPIHINGMAVERVSSFKFLGTHITEDLSWSTNTSSLLFTELDKNIISTPLAHFIQQLQNTIGFMRTTLMHPNGNTLHPPTFAETVIRNKDKYSEYFSSNHRKRKRKDHEYTNSPNTPSLIPVVIDNIKHSIFTTNKSIFEELIRCTPDISIKNPKTHSSTQKLHMARQEKPHQPPLNNKPNS